MAESNAGEIKLGVGLSTDPLQEQAPKVEKTAEKVGKSIGEAVDKGSTETLKKASEKIGRTAEKTGTDSGRKFTGGFKKSLDSSSGGIIASAVKLAGKLAAVFAGKKIFDFGKSAIEAGSDLSEVQNVVDSTFTRMGDKVDEFARNAAAKFGLSETMAKRYAGTFGAMGKAFGFSEEKAYDMSTALTGLAGDVASFYNITQDEAYTKLKSVFTGETESLKDLGVVMTQTALDDYALRSGIGKTVQQMTEAEKVTLRYGFVMDQLSTASGDFSRTADGWANQVRILTLQFQSLKAAIGQGLIAALNPVIHAVNRFMAVLVKAANVFSAFMQKLFGVKAAAGAMGSAVSGAIDNITGGTADAINGIDGVGNAASGAAKKATKAVQQLKRTLEGFDQITKVKETADAAAGSSGSGGGGGAGGGIGGSDAGAMEDFASATEAAGESMSRLDAIVERFKEKLEPARKALERLREQLEKLGGHLGEGLKWLYDNVLVPLADWTITEVIPRFFDTLANVLHIFDSVLVALQPLWQWFWDNVLKPVAAWTAGAFLTIWDKINEVLAKFGDWCDKNAEKIQVAAVAIGSFFAALGVVKVAGIIAGIIGKLAAFGSTVIGIISSIQSFAGGISLIVSLLGGPLVLGIAAAIAAGILIWKNWDKIKAVGKKVAESIKDSVEKVRKKFADIKKKIDSFTSKVIEKFEAIKETIKSVKEFIEDLPNKLTIDAAVSLVKKGWDKVSDFVKKHTGSIVEKAVNLSKNGWDNVKSWIEKKNFGGKVEKAIGVVRDGWNSVSDWISKKNMGGKVEKAIGVVRDGWNSVSDWISKKNMGGKVDKAIGVVRNGWTSVSDWITKKNFGGKVDKGIGVVRSGWNSVADWITKKNFGGAVNKNIGLSKTWRSVASWIQDRMGGAVQKTIGLTKTWGSVASWIWDRMGGAVQKTIGLTKTWHTVADWVSDRIGGTVEVGISLFRSGWSTVKGFVDRFERGGSIGRNGTIRYFASGGKIKGSTATWFDALPHYAAGTSKAHGTAFIAGENGPEIVGNVNGSTEVLNKSQIAASVSSGVMRALIGGRAFNADAYIPRLIDVGNGIRQDLEPIVQLARSAESAQASGGIAEMVQILRQILRLLETLDFDVKIDGKSLKDHIVRLINENTQATGVCEIIV